MIASITGKTAEMATLLLLAVVVPRVLGARAYGEFAVPLTIVTLGSLALTLGGPTVMTRFVPAAAPHERVAVAKAIGIRLAQGRALQLLGLTSAAVILVLVRPGTFPPVATALVMGALMLNVVATLGLQISLGLGRAAAWSARYPLHNAVLVVAVLALHTHGLLGGITAILLAAAASALLAAAVTAPLLRTDETRVEVPRGAVRFGAFQAVGAALSQATHRGGVLAVAVLVESPTETGFAALATGITLGVTYAVLQTFTVSLPHVIAADDDTATTNSATAEARLRGLAVALAALLVPATATAAILLDELVPRAFGDDYSGAVGAFGPALALIVLAPLTSFTTQAASLRVRPEITTIAGASGAVAFLLVAAIAVPGWEAAGATAAALAAGATAAIVAMALLPGAVGPRLATLSLGGSTLVLGVAAWA